MINVINREMTELRRESRLRDQLDADDVLEVEQGDDDLARLVKETDRSGVCRQLVRFCNNLLRAEDLVPSLVCHPERSHFG